VERLSRADAANSTLRGNLSAMLGNAAIVHDALGHPAEALSLYQRVKDFKEKLARDFPEDPAQRVQLARTINNLRQRCADNAGRLKYHERALVLRDELVSTYPDSQLYRCELARSSSKSGLSSFLPQGPTSRRT
jgi:hypothetical protein